MVERVPPQGAPEKGSPKVPSDKPQKYYQYSRNCDLLAVIEPVLQKLRSLQADGSLLVMSANNDRDSIRKWKIAQDELVAFNSVASSAGSTATMAVLVQSATGHLNGRPSYPFDQEDVMRKRRLLLLDHRASLLSCHRWT